MTSRERVRAALAHREADVVPVDLWGSASRLDNEFYQKLVSELRYQELGERLRPGTTSEYVDYRISDLIGSDFRHIDIGAPTNFIGYTNEGGHYINEWGIGKKKIGKYPTISYHPLADAEPEDSVIDNYHWPVAADPGRIDGLAEKARNWYENSECAITATSAVSGQFFDNGQYMRGAEEFFIDLYVNKQFAHKLIDKITEKILEINLYYLAPIAPYIEWVEFSSDLGTQMSSFVSPETFREFFKEPFRLLFSELKRAYPNLKIFLHSCGAIFNLIPDLIDVGVDVLNPLQPLAQGMDSFRIKKEFGSDLVLHGGIDIQRAMIGSRQDVEDEVKKRIDAFARGGGYILAPNNHIQSDVPVSNFLDLYRFAKQYGKYPIQF
ncbi:MAG: hypothetical protein HGA87_03995 [Desulfobulbaceae bacterium]|nr:hypothetical protein [Desulfobulbaceae bacterium]